MDPVRWTGTDWLECTPGTVRSSVLQAICCARHKAFIHGPWTTGMRGSGRGARLTGQGRGSLEIGGQWLLWQLLLPDALAEHLPWLARAQHLHTVVGSAQPSCWDQALQLEAFSLLISQAVVASVLFLRNSVSAQRHLRTCPLGHRWSCSFCSSASFLSAVHWHQEPSSAWGHRSRVYVWLGMTPGPAFLSPAQNISIIRYPRRQASRKEHGIKGTKLLSFKWNDSLDLISKPCVSSQMSPLRGHFHFQCSYKQPRLWHQICIQVHTLHSLALKKKILLKNVLNYSI